MITILRPPAWLAVFALCAAGSAHAQTVTASVTGTVRDASEALVPGATYVIETNTGRGSGPFSVPSGQNVRLPDVVVDPPPKPKKP